MNIQNVKITARNVVARNRATPQSNVDCVTKLREAYKLELETKNPQGVEVANASEALQFRNAGKSLVPPIQVFIGRMAVTEKESKGKTPEQIKALSDRRQVWVQELIPAKPIFKSLGKPGRKADAATV